MQIIAKVVACLLLQCAVLTTSTNEMEAMNEALLQGDECVADGTCALNALQRNIKEKAEAADVQRHEQATGANNTDLDATMCNSVTTCGACRTDLDCPNGYEIPMCIGKCIRGCCQETADPAA